MFGEAGEQLLVVVDTLLGIGFQGDELLEALEMDRDTPHEQIPIIVQDATVIVDGQRPGVYVAVRVGNEEKVISVVDVGGALFDVTGEEKDLAIQTTRVARPEAICVMRTKRFSWIFSLS